MPYVEVVTLFAEYTDPRIVAVYDTVCPLGADSALIWAWRCCELRGVDRDRHRLRHWDPTCELPVLERSPDRSRPGARHAGRGVTRPDGERGGGSTATRARLGNEQADLVIMTSHVAQVITDDDEWHATLAAAHRALRGGGHFALRAEIGAEVWAAGEIYAAVRHFDDAANGPFDMWQEVIDVVEGRVLYELHYRFPDGVELVSQNELRFRTQAELTDGLVDAGFAVERVFGDWDRAPVGDGTPELDFVARR